MDKSDENSPFTDIQSSGQNPSVSSDKAFSDSVGSSAGVAPTPGSQPLSSTPNDVSKPEHKRRPPVVAIILAVIVSGALAAATIYAYRQYNKPAANGQTSETADSVNGTDVDSTSDEVDKTVNDLNAEQDFSESELTDTTLGL